MTLFQILASHVDWSKNMDTRGAELFGDLVFGFRQWSDTVPLRPLVSLCYNVFIIRHLKRHQKVSVCGKRLNDVKSDTQSTLSYVETHFEVSQADGFGKHCGKRRNCL